MKPRPYITRVIAMMMLWAASNAAAQSATSVLPHDVNGDGQVDVTDINIIIATMLNGGSDTKTRADVNGDGTVDVSDVNSVVNWMLDPYGDVDERSTYTRLAIPLIEVTTVDDELPTCEYVAHPSGAMGKGITNTTKVPGRILVSMKGDTLYDSGDYEKGVSGMTIKITGNSSAYRDNKPYKIKLQAKADLLCRGDSTLADKEWRLMRDYTTLNTMMGWLVSEIVGMKWTPRYQWVNLMINGKYAGLYILAECVKRNTKARIAVKKTGYIVERDAYWWLEDVYFRSTYFNNARYGWTFKYPENSDVTPEQIDYIQGVINQAEASVADGTYDQYIDVDSWAKWLLAHDILGTWDTGGSNLFIAKNDSTAASPLEMVCLWDFDSNMRMGIKAWSRFHNDPNADFLFSQLAASSNTAFVDSYHARWAQLRDTLLPTINARLDSLVASPVGVAIDVSRQYHKRVYNSSITTVKEDAATYKNWMKSHLEWMDSNMTQY